MTVDQLVRPLHMWVPEHVGTYGDEAADLSAMYGKPLFPEQRLAVDALMTYRAGGRWASLERAIVQPRQNGKSAAILLAVVMADLFLFNADRVVWTAHLFKTARDAFLEAQRAVEGTPELSRRVKQIFASSQDFAIHLHSGARLEFLARSKGGGRGLGGKTVVMDEALYLTSDHIGALMPTLSARENPHLLYGSSAGLEESEQLRRLRLRGRAGNDPSLTWVEWCAPEGTCATEGCGHEPGTTGCALDDRELWHQANPMLGRLIREDYVEGERRGMTPEQFATERLGWWRDPIGASDDIPLDKWAALADRRAAAGDPISVAVDVAPFGTSAAVAVCGRDPRGDDDQPVIELLRHDRKRGWVVDELVAMRTELGEFGVTLDPSGASGGLIPELEKAGFEVTSLSGRDAASACEAFVVAVAEGTLLHRDDPPLNDALAGARLREVGDAHRLSRRNSTVDISPLVACVNAYFSWLRQRDDDAAPNLW